MDQQPPPPPAAGPPIPASAATSSLLTSAPFYSPSLPVIREPLGAESLLRQAEHGVTSVIVHRPPDEEQQGAWQAGTTLSAGQHTSQQVRPSYKFNATVLFILRMI